MKSTVPFLFAAFLQASLAAAQGGSEPEPAQGDPAPPPTTDGGEEATPGDDTSPAEANEKADTGGLAEEQAGVGTEKEAETVETVGELDAEEAPRKKPIVERDSERAEDDVYGHGMQAGLRVGIVHGYRMIFRYDDSPFCAIPDPTTRKKDEQKFCGHVGQPAVEVALSFAPTDGIEPFVWARFGITDGEPETNTEPVRMFGAGLRIYTMADSRFKILVEPAVGGELEGGAGNKDFIKPPNLAEGSDAFEADYKKDLIFRLAAGPQYDFAKAVGLYLSAGMTVGVLRAIHASLEGNLGVQIRVP